MEFRVETVYSRTTSANTGILDAPLWLGNRDRAFLAVASFVAKNSGSACPGELSFAFLVFRTLRCACRNIGRRWKEPLPMPPQKQTRVLASRCAGVTVPEFEQSKAAVLSALASAHSRRSYEHAIE